MAAFKTVDPAQPLVFNVRLLGLDTDVLSFDGTVRLAKCVTAGGKRHGFFVVHRHAREGFANVARRSERVRIAVRAFRIYIDQTHLHRSERIRKLTVAAVTLVAQPLGFRAPVNIIGWLPHVGAAAGKAEGLKAHGLHRDVAGEDEKVGPR